MMARRVLALLCLVLGSSTAFAGDALTPEQQRGREIYRRGQIAGVSVGVALVGAEGMSISSTSFPCANCHGVFGEGGREGGIAVPSLNWRRLTSPAVSTVSGQSRGVYARDTLRQAIAAGLDPERRRLHESMPRFTMPDARLSEVIAYLERIGDDEDTDPGVSPTTIRIGAALPLSGPLAAAGAAIRETMERVFAAASADGRIYGRRIELMTEDSRGDAAGLREATRRLIENGDVFVLAASFTTSGSDDTGHLLEKAAMPLIGPITLSPHQVGVPNPYVFYLLPSLYDQARALVDFISAQKVRGARDTLRRPRVAVIHAGNAADLAAIEGLHRQVVVHGMEVVAEERDAPRAVGAVLAKRPDYLIYAGDGAGLKRVARQLDHESQEHAPALAGFISTSQGGLSDLPERVAARALFVAPALPPDARQAASFISILPTGDASPTFPGLRTAAFATCTVLVEALRANGSRLSRPGLVRTLERFQHFETGVTQPITFGPNRRNGNAGAAILAYEPQGRSFSAVSGWISPRD